MSVCDASLIGNALLAGGQIGDLAATRLAEDDSWHAPHLIDAEMTSIARRLVRSGELDSGVAAAGLDRLDRMRMTRHPFGPHRERVWQLRDNATPYDAWYLALAERLGVALVTADEKLAGVPGVACDVEVII